MHQMGIMLKETILHIISVGTKVWLVAFIFCDGSFSVLSSCPTVLHQQVFYIPFLSIYQLIQLHHDIRVYSNNLKTSRVRTYLHQHSCWPSQLHDWTFHLRSQIGCPDETSEELGGFQRPGSTKGLHRGQLAMDSLIVKTTKLWMQTPEIFIIEIWKKQQCKVFPNSSFLKLQDLDCYTVPTIQNLKF